MQSQHPKIGKLSSSMAGSSALKLLFYFTKILHFMRDPSFKKKSCYYDISSGIHILSKVQRKFLPVYIFYNCKKKVL